MQIDPQAVIENRLATGMGLDRYAKIMNAVNLTDVSKDAGFQRVFNGFYLVRRNAEWRNVYYDLFETLKTQRPTFEDIFTILYEKSGNLEASFSSKMLATINPDMPIWDHYVVQNLGIKAEKSPAGIIAAYKKIRDWYSLFLDTENARECIDAFDKVLPSYQWLSDIKKIDFFLWSIR